MSSSALSSGESGRICSARRRRCALPGGPLGRAALSLAVALAVVTGAWAAVPGELDPSFSGDGMATVALSPVFDAAVAVTVARDQGMLVAASSWPRRGENSDFVVARYRADGSLDPAFGEKGIARVDFAGGWDGVGDVIEQPDGKILLVGGATWYTAAHKARPGFGIARLLSDGRRDPSFGENGVRIVPTVMLKGKPDAAGASAVTLAGDGRIMVVGGAGCGGECGDDLRIAALRLQPDGSLDRTFSGDGVWSSYVGCAATGVAVQPDGMILIGGATGSRDYCSFGKMLLLRMRPDGSIDRDWARNGRRTIGFPRARNAGAAALALDGHGRALLAGQAGNRVGLARVLPDGRLDQAFGDRGRVTTRFARRGSGYATGVALFPDGSATVSVDYQLRGGRVAGFGVARFTADGRLDPSFATGGRQRITFGVKFARASDVAVDALNRTIAVGFAYHRRTEGDVAVARLR